MILKLAWSSFCSYVYAILYFKFLFKKKKWRWYTSGAWFQTYPDTVPELCYLIAVAGYPYCTCSELNLERKKKNTLQ